MPNAAHLPIPVDVIVIPREERPARLPEDDRPELAAESMRLGGRLGLALLATAVLVGDAVFVIAALALPFGWLELGVAAVPAFAVLLGLHWMLVVVFGALAENNRRLNRRGHALWLTTLLLGGPVGMLAYWTRHVWPTSYVPRAT